ncbi:hypothetical protein BDZ89DRAFT_1066650 [Hymenopellis radicata]|nr:hypothetical protein BDZ89DRAFT_1066650 [Hymenopellis radicata]
MATTVATLQTPQPPPAPRVYTTDDIKQYILTKWEANQPFWHRFPVTSRTLVEVEEMLPTLPCSNNMRTSYTVADGLIVRWMASAAHEAASHTFNLFVAAAFDAILQLPKRSCDLFDPSGSTTYCIATPNKEWKQPDENFCPIEANSPSVILEVGVSEHQAELHSDAAWWLTSTRFHVKLEPKIRFEHWEMAEVDRHRRVPVRLHVSDWSDKVPDEGVYRLPTEAFVPNGDTRAEYNLPDYLSPTKKNMQALRMRIIRAWRREKHYAAHGANADMH